MAKRNLDDLRDCLLKNYSTQGPEWCADATGYSLSYVRMAASILGVRAPWHGGGGKTRAPVWTERELAYLRHSYGVEPVSVLVNRLGRTKQAIHQKATRLGLGRRRGMEWDEDCDEIVREHYPARGAEFVSKIIGCTVVAVRHRASHLGLRRTDKVSTRFKT